MEYSKTLNKLTGNTEQQIQQLLNQMRIIQEETADQIRQLQKQIAELKKKEG